MHLECYSEDWSNHRTVKLCLHPLQKYLDLAGLSFSRLNLPSLEVMIFEREYKGDKS